MNLFDSASLIVTPNGQKAGKLYSIKPTDGSGDLSVTRATSATRVDANGLVEIPRTNLVLQSQTFDNASWIKTAATITANASTAPDGTLTADKFIPNTSATNHAINSNSFTSGTNTISVYAKMDGYRYLVILSATANASFDLMNGVVANNSGGGFVSYSITNAGNGWYRCVLTATSISSIFISGGSSSAPAFFNGAGDGTSGIYIWGAQVELGNALTEYIPTVASIRTKFAGITQDGSSASNIPRLDYTNSSCPSILVEPQRTNTSTYSEDFSNAVWTKTRCSITSNSIISPDGTLTADTLVEDSTASSTHPTSQSVTVTASAQTFSIYAKSANRNWLQLQFLSTSNATAFFDLSNGVIGTVGSAATASIQSVGNGWYRCIITATTTAGSNTIGIYPASANGTNSYTGNGTASLYIWGSQLEAGSNATSYIPTVAASVTRNADVISKTGISSLIGQTEGTLLVDVNYEAEGIFKNYLNLGTSTTSYIAIVARANNKIGMEVLNSTAQVNASSTATYSTNQRLKIAMTYKLNDFKLYVNGVLQATDTSGTVPAKAEIYLGSYGNGTNQSMDGINLAAIYKTVLTDEQLIQLTTI
jgi:hypothetical protein